MNMKTTIRTAVLFFVALVSSALLIAQTESETIDQKIERLIKPLFDSNFQARKAQNSLSEIRSLPGITDALFEKLEAELASPNAVSYRLSALMTALAERADYRPELMEAIRAKAKWALGAVNTGADRAHFFAEGNLRILGNNPGLENEEVIISALSPALDSVPGVQERAVYALQKSGSRRSKEALEALAQRIAPKPGNKNRLYDLAVETVAIVSARKSPERSPNLVPQVKPPQSDQSPARKPSDAMLPEAAPTHDSTPWLVWTVLIVGAIGLLRLVLKNRK